VIAFESMKIKDPKNLRIFLTGGSSGIGLAMAKLLFAAGAHVHLFSRDKRRLESAIAELEASRANPSQQLSYKRLDVSKSRDVKRVMESTVSDFGVPDVLINCAGMARPNYFEQISFDQFDRILKVNLYGAWNTTSVLIPHMKRRGRGYIVNVSSMVGLMPIFGYSDYSASKSALIAFSKVLRSEMKPNGITVSVVLPTDTDTPGFVEENKTKPLETKAVSEWAKVVKPEKIARGLLKGMRKGRFLIIPTFLDRLFYFIDRLFPRFVEFMIDQDAKKARKKRGETDNG
jgi:short-subunit dehydrogenase